MLETRFRSILTALGAILSLLGAPTFALADVISELRFQSDSFLSPAYDSAPQSTYQFLGARFANEGPKTPVELEMNAAYAIGAPLLSYINVREASYRIGVNDSQSVVVGRKLQRWSELDRRWNFGLIEPVFKWNPLSPESQGLTGFFWEMDDPSYRLVLFGSPMYLPNQGPSFEINQEGEFERGNPWFSRPPSSIRLLDQTSRIEYVFDRPNETSVVFQTSYGAQLTLGGETPWRARASMLYLPMNELALGYDGSMVIPNGIRGVVEIHPQVVFHNISSADVAYVGSKIAAGISVAYDQPDSNNKFEDQWTYPTFEPAVLVSPWIDIHLAKGWKLSLQSLHVQGGEVVEKGELSQPPHVPITARFPYTEAGQIALETDMRLMQGRRLILKGSYTQSELNDFRLFRAQGRLQLSRLWSLQSELQLVDAGDVTIENPNRISEFRNNDRVLLGVGYAF